MVRPERLSAAGASTSAAHPDIPEGPPPLYPPLLIPEPYISDRKRAVMNGMLKYKHLIATTRARYTGENFKSNGLFHLPDFGPPKLKPKTKVKPIKIIALEKADDAEKDADTEDEDKPSAGAKADDDEDAEAKSSDEDEDDADVAAKSDSDIDDYTAAAGFDDDEMNFEDTGVDADNDAQTY